MAGNTFASDTWEWDGANWVQHLPATSPPARGVHAQAYDAARGRVVVFGGGTSSSGPNPTSDTWEWDGVNWAQRSPATSPSARYGVTMAYDSARARLVLFGGWDSPPAPFLGLMSDTWEYGPTNPAALVPFGSGCAGSAGTPALASSEKPWIGENFTVTVSPIPTNAPALVALGRSKSSWGGIPLPLPLDFLGMTGCTLFASGEFFFVAASLGGVATLTLPLPGDSSLLGGSFFNQGVVIDPPANAFGATLSNAAEGRIGSK